MLISQQSTLFVADFNDETPSKEISLFSIKLKPTYELFGYKYDCLGAVNYFVENDDGGHYITYLFPSAHECLRIHETDAKIQQKKPDFDNETVIVALKQIGMASKL